MSLSAVTARMIAARGRTMILRRDGETNITLKGVRQVGTIVETGGSSRQQEFDVRIAPTELEASAWAQKVPKSGSDILVVDGRSRAVLSVEALYDGDDIAMYALTVAG